MKKLVLTIAVVLGMGLCSFGQQAQGGGLFQYGEVTDETENASWYVLNQDQELLRNNGLMPNLPGHGQDNNQNAPLGSGALLLIGFGAAYALKKKNQK